MVDIVSLSPFSRVNIHVDGLTVLFAYVKRLGLAFKFRFKFPVGGSVPVIFISLIPAVQLLFGVDGNLVPRAFALGYEVELMGAGTE